MREKKEKVSTGRQGNHSTAVFLTQLRHLYEQRFYLCDSSRYLTIVRSCCLISDKGFQNISITGLLLHGCMGGGAGNATQIIPSAADTLSAYIYTGISSIV